MKREKHEKWMPPGLFPVWPQVNPNYIYVTEA
jgi:hypothetical protein